MTLHVCAPPPLPPTPPIHTDIPTFSYMISMMFLAENQVFDKSQTFVYMSTD